MNDEYLDVLDERGRLTGDKLPKNQLHDQQLWHGVAHVWIYNKQGQILLQKRHQNVKWGANNWDLAAGGHIAAGETPLQAAIRETKEEIGLDLKESELELAGITTSANITPWTEKEHKTYEWNYIVMRNLDPKTMELQADETADLKWFDLDEFEADIKSPEASNKYAPRQRELYQRIIDNVRKKLRSKNG